MDGKRKRSTTNKNRKRAWISAYRVATNTGRRLPRYDADAYFADADDEDDDMYAEQKINNAVDFVMPVDDITDVLQPSSFVEAAVESMSHYTSPSAATADSVTECYYDWFDENFEPYTSSDSESDSNIVNDGTLSEKLADWVNEFGIKHNAVDKLLCLLQSAGHRLPATARTLLKTPKDVVISEKSGMQYAYLDICKQLSKFVKRLPQCSIENLEEFEISLNIDGLPLFKSSSTSLWPILCAVVNVIPVQVFPVAIVCGSSKPSDLMFLTDTVNDLIKFLDCGLMVDGKHFAIHLRCIVCDAPAKAMVKSVKMYSGYEGCDKCTQHGKWMGRMTFPEVSDVDYFEN